MTLAEAISRFLETRTNDPASPSAPGDSAATLHLLNEFVTQDTNSTELTSTTIREFLARWYFEKAILFERSALAGVASSPDDRVPTPDELIESLIQFFFWLDALQASSYSNQFSEIFARLRETLPNALRLTRGFTNAMSGKGAFSFPEFLTSFEEGGRSQYDVDFAGETSAMDGYFRVVNVYESSIEALELVSDKAVGPIDLPADVAEILAEGYVISLEIVRERNRWKIVGCGFAYPPEFEI